MNTSKPKKTLTNQHKLHSNTKHSNLKEIKLKKSINDVVDDLFFFVQKNNINDDTSSPGIRDYIKQKYHKKLLKYTESELETYIESIKHINLYDSTNYECKKSVNLYSFMNSLSRFRDELLIYIDVQIKKEDLSKYKLERLISPPLEAYEYIGHTKTNIKSSGRDFGLLFE
ncbi:MAG: hypothetical protein WC758_05975 [Candidatus Woesearchaeota archaeon]|jgi:hypothetical protein